MLERATRLLNSEDGNHKLSLKQLLVGDSDSDTEQETSPKVAAVTASKKDEVKSTNKKKAGRPAATSSTTSAASKTTTVKKPVKQPTPGTRRSSRLKTPIEEAVIDDQVVNKEAATDVEIAVKKEVPTVAAEPELDDDDDNQLVIDETPDEPMEVVMDKTETVGPSNKKGRGRPKKDIIPKQDTVTTVEKSEVKPEVKLEVKEVKEDITEILKPKTRNQSGSR